MSMSSRSGSGKVLGQNSADIFRRCTAARSTSEEAEEGQTLAGLHLVVSVWNDKRGYRNYSYSSYDQEWSGQSNYPRFPFPTKSSDLLGSCNGLLCLEITDSSGFANGIGNKCVVWEPSTNKLQLIPQPDSMKRPCEYSSIKHDCITDVVITGGGLFFDSRSGDYKFFCFTMNYYLDNSECSVFHGLPRYVQVYSVKNNAWKELSCPLFNGQEIEGHGKGICVNGVCYWSAHCVTDFSFMLSFNFATEEFSSFRGPECERNHAYELVELDGSLGALIYPNKTTAEDDWKGVFSLMVYSPSPSSSPSWSRVDLDDVPVVGFHEPLWFGKRNDSYYLLLKGPQGVLLEYDYSGKVFNQIHKMPGPVDDCEAFAYETKTTKNNADIWHSSSFHEVEVQKRFAIYASHQTGEDY